MRIEPIQLQHKSHLINDYQHHEQKIMDYFDYSPVHDYKQRILDLQKRFFKREKLTQILYTVNKQWDAPQSTFSNIDRLKDQESVVVIGGQQAGVMTGPLYSMNKIISIIQFAKKQEAHLNVPVIPVFWIAGEDHDYDEINHVFFLKDQKMLKHPLKQEVHEKRSVSHIEIDRTYATQWLDELFLQLTETNYTKDLYVSVKECLEKSTTYVDFFARLIFQLFQEEGLVLIDSGSPELRNLESDYFVELIENQAGIASCVHDSFQQLTQEGYSIPLDVGENDGHLFIYKDHERILLEVNEHGDWMGKQGEMKLTTEQLLKIAKEKPTLLSNNVVSRPMMQELVFPTLAFVGGLGEVTYWAVLKKAFHKLGMKMPPVLPRLSFTFIDQQTEKKLKKYAIPSALAVNEGVEQRKMNWLAAQSTPPLEHISEQLKQIVKDAHEPLRNIAANIRVDLGELANENLQHLFHDIDFLAERIYKAQEEKFAEVLDDFNELNVTLFPNGGLQERIWNPLPLINMHGYEFIKQLTTNQCSFTEDHYLVYL